MHHGAQKDDAFWDVQTQPAMGMLYRQPSNGDKSDVFFCPFTVQHILYLCNFPAQITLLLLHLGNRMCYNINVAFFVPFRDIEKGKVFCRAILIIIHLENESP